MRITITYLLCLCLFSCQNISHKEDEIFDFSFYSTIGTHYQISTVGEQIQARHPTLKKPIIIAVVSSEPVTGNQKLRNQHDIFDQFGGEEYQYIYIMGSSVEPYNHSYHVTEEVAQELLSGSDFKILIFNRDAELVVEKDTVMPYEEVDKYLSAMQ
ncbi:MAG: hypothetical protein P8X74_22945 [Reinekea sp.]